MILDTLMLIDDGSLGVTLPVFTVNTAVPEVVVTYIAAPNTWYGVFAEPFNRPKFIRKDNLIIRSVAVVLPYCFSQSGPAYFGLSWREGGTDYSVAEWGSAGRQWIFTNQVEIETGVYVAWNPQGPGVAGADLAVNSLSIPISMVGVPASFNAAVLPIQIWAKVEHNAALTV